MRHIRSTLLVLPILLMTATAAQAQDIGSAFGSRMLPREEVPPVVVGIEAVPEERRVIPFVLPLFLDTDGAQVGQLAAGIVLPSGQHPVSAKVTYSWIEPDGAGSLDKLALSIDGRLVTVERGRLNLKGTIGDADDLPQTLRAGVYGEILLWRNQAAALSLGADLLWASSKKGGTSVEDAILSPRLLLERGSFGAGLSYTLDNDVDRDDSYSGELNYLVSRSKTLFGLFAGSDDTFGAYVHQRF